MQIFRYVHVHMCLYEGFGILVASESLLGGAGCFYVRVLGPVP